MRKVMIGGNEQLSITIPKRWANDNGVRKGDYVEIVMVEEPVIEILKEIKEKGEEIIIEGNNNVFTGRSEILRFVDDGVELVTGEIVRFVDIKKLSRNIKRRLEKDE